MKVRENKSVIRNARRNLNQQTPNKGNLNLNTKGVNNSLDAVGLSSSKRKGTSHYRVVGMENSTGNFISGEKVPHGMRPTVFWEH